MARMVESQRDGAAAASSATGARAAARGAETSEPVTGRRSVPAPAAAAALVRTPPVSAALDGVATEWSRAQRGTPWPASHALVGVYGRRCSRTCSGRSGCGTRSSRRTSRRSAASSWWAGQQAIVRSAFATPLASLMSRPVDTWGVDLDLQPTVGWAATVLRPLDVLRPQLLDVCRAVDIILGATWWAELTEGLWCDLVGAGGRSAFWAVLDARVALERGDMPALQKFVDRWLDAAVTDARVETLVEALLEFDLGRYTPDDGRQLLTDLTTRVQALTRSRRREQEALQGFRRGAGTVAALEHEETTVVHQLGTRGGSSLEDDVLDRVQPDVDPRLIETVNELPPRDRTIAILKYVTGCAWSAAAVHAGAPEGRGEVVRRRHGACPCRSPRQRRPVG